MTTRTTPRAGGFQIALLVFAVIFLAYPIQKYLGPMLGMPEPGSEASRLFIFVLLALLLALVPEFRRFSIDQLRTPIAGGRGLEAAVVVLSKSLVVPIAAAGAIVLWHWCIGGEMGLARRIGQQETASVSLAKALTPEGLFFWFVLAGVVAPIIEELIFRGLLYHAWEARWGWGWSMLATSALFAAYHPVPFAAFASALIFVAVYRRTGSIWAPIIVHGFGNMMTSPILMGGLYFRTAGKETGEIGLWSLHLAALGLLLAIVPIYVWMAGDSRLPATEEPSTEIRCA